MKITKQRLKEIIKEELEFMGRDIEDIADEPAEDDTRDRAFASPEERLLILIKAREVLSNMTDDKLEDLSMSLDADMVASLRHILANPTYAPREEGVEELEEVQDPEELRRRRAMLKQAALEVDKGRLHVGDLKRIQQRIRDGERVFKIVRDYPRNFPAYR